MRIKGERTAEACFGPTCPGGDSVNGILCRERGAANTPKSRSLEVVFCRFSARYIWQPVRHLARRHDCVVGCGDCNRKRPGLVNKVLK